MGIHYSNRSRLPAAQEKNAVFHADPEAMLAQCDFLSINCPLTPQTRHWLNAARIARLPDGAIVVNTARGPVVDDAALIAAVKAGKLAAIGLDVFDGEPRLNPGYYELPNAFLLPHLGSGTLETRNAMGFRALDNLEAVLLRGDPPPHAVKPA
jgi:lactate dehydrogenase-like 2-hydroxyacid dehydrogenase